MENGTVYKKITRSRNLLICILIGCIVLVGVKVVFAHEKIKTYHEAVRLFNKGELIAAEKQFRAAKLNPFVLDYNHEITAKLGILSPIKKKIDSLDKNAKSAANDHKLHDLVSLQQDYEKNKQKWLNGTAVQKDMFGEMIALTSLEKDFESYFQTEKKSFYHALEQTPTDEEENQIFADLQSIPVLYFGNEKQKTNDIQKAFHTYFSTKIDDYFQHNSFAESTDESKRQLMKLPEFSMNTSWLQKRVNDFILTDLTKALNNEDYETFANDAKIANQVKVYLKGYSAFTEIESLTNSLFAKADALVSKNQYEDAISIYNALNPLHDTADLITQTEHKWDRHEPIRVLKKLYPDKEFDSYVNGENGAESYVAAITTDHTFYFGRIGDDDENMSVTEGTVDKEPITTLKFYNNLSVNGNPVVYFETKANERTHHYIAYEVFPSSVEKILDLEADSMTMESPQVLLVKNAVGDGEGELAYYEPSYNGMYEFTKIKVDYVDINVEDLTSYIGQKVRMNVYIDSSSNGQALVDFGYVYNEETGYPEPSYLLLKTGGANLRSGNNYTVIGTFKNKHTNITDSDGNVVNVPVFDVDEFE